MQKVPISIVETQHRPFNSYGLGIEKTWLKSRRGHCTLFVILSETYTLLALQYAVKTRTRFGGNCNHVPPSLCEDIMFNLI